MTRVARATADRRLDHGTYTVGRAMLCRMGCQRRCAQPAAARHGAFRLSGTSPPVVSLASSGPDARSPQWAQIEPRDSTAGRNRTIPQAPSPRKRARLQSGETGATPRRRRTGPTQAHRCTGDGADTRSLRLTCEPAGATQRELALRTQSQAGVPLTVRNPSLHSKPGMAPAAHRSAVATQTDAREARRTARNSNVGTSHILQKRVQAMQRRSSKLLHWQLPSLGAPVHTAQTERGVAAQRPPHRLR